jgi:hypothetical protein
MFGVPVALIVTPAKAGVQTAFVLDTGLRRYDGKKVGQ